MGFFNVSGWALTSAIIFGGVIGATISGGLLGFLVGKNLHIFTERLTLEKLKKMFPSLGIDVDALSAPRRRSDSIVSDEYAVEGEVGSTLSLRRCGAVIRMRPEKYEEYAKLHASVWPTVKDRLLRSNIRNYTIYYSPELEVLFSHYEYVGSDYASDMREIEEDEVTRKWWKLCEPCQEPLVWEGPTPSEGGSGEWWTQLNEVWHDDVEPTGFHFVHRS